MSLRKSLHVASPGLKWDLSPNPWQSQPYYEPATIQNRLSPMKKSILFSTLTLMAGTLLAADSEDVKDAAKKLAAQNNYSWKTTVVVPEGSRFRPGPTEGKTEKDGYTWLSM